MKKIQVKLGLGNRLNGGQGQNKIDGAHIYIYIMWTLQYIHDNLGSRLYGGQGQNKIGGAHLRHVGLAMHV